MADEVADRARAAAELRLGGSSYQVIAADLGFESALVAEVAVRQALDLEPEESPVLLLRIEVARLDAMIEGLWPKASDGDAASASAVARMMSQRRAVAGQLTGGELPVSDPPTEEKSEAASDDDVVTSLEARRAGRGRATSSAASGAGV